MNAGDGYLAYENAHESFMAIPISNLIEFPNERDKKHANYLNHLT